jgi:hypothetical protein
MFSNLFSHHFARESGKMRLLSKPVCKLLVGVPKRVQKLLLFSTNPFKILNPCSQILLHVARQLYDTAAISLYFFLENAVIYFG